MSDVSFELRRNLGSTQNFYDPEIFYHTPAQCAGVAKATEPVFSNQFVRRIVNHTKSNQLTTSVIIPTWRRSGQLKDSLVRILACSPPPTEVLVHVDAGDEDSPSMLKEHFPLTVQWTVAERTRGPGGGRNVLAHKAVGDLLVSLDDDSWPEDSDFFGRVIRLAEQQPDVGAFAALVTEPNRQPNEYEGLAKQASSFVNCGCVIRRKAFLETNGYLDLRYAYGMEETDVALQLIDLGWKILYVPWLRVYHDTVLAHHVSWQINASHISNAGLLAYLRYPHSYWGFGFFQVINRVAYAIKKGRFAGIFHGLLNIPKLCYFYRHLRQPVQQKTLKISRVLR